MKLAVIVKDPILTFGLEVPTRAKSILQRHVNKNTALVHILLLETPFFSITEHLPDNICAMTMIVPSGAPNYLLDHAFINDYISNLAAWH
jgi:hypothetical protein